MSVNACIHKIELGMAKSSMLMKTLSDSSNISSRLYSFYWGCEIAKEPRDGSLKLGGHDQALIANGPNVIVPLIKKTKCRKASLNFTSLRVTSGDGTKDACDDLPNLRVCVIATTSNIMTIFPSTRIRSTVSWMSSV
jgi:hypothetical protein